MLVRALSATAALSLLVYVFTPTTALGPPQKPVLFIQNLRYALPALLPALVLAPAVLRRRASMWVYIMGLATVVLVTVIPERRSPTALIGTLFTISVFGLVARWRPRLTMSRFAVVATMAGVLAIGYPLQISYMSDRFRLQKAEPSANLAERRALAWARDVRNARIGIAGFFRVYPLYGPDLSNRVRYVGDLRPDHEFTDYRTCAAWRAAVNRGRYDYIVTMPPFPLFPEHPATRWTATDPAAVPVLWMGKVGVFRISGRLDPFACPKDAFKLPEPLSGLSG
jgi:hypothetical protein